jgi:ribosomal protein L16 Arg81 hydroxylase
MGWDLATLVQPLEVSTFLERYWSRRAIAIAGENPARFTSLFSWVSLNRVLNYQPLHSPSEVRLVRDGQPLPISSPQATIAALQQGATLIVNGLHGRDPALATLAAALRDGVGHRVQINSYCTPAQQQGFDCHYDTHEVFVLQLDGAKEWFVFEPSVIAPTGATRSPDDVPPNTPPYLKTVLQPGDVLYVPRGHWHYAMACGERPSFHLTIGIDCETGLDWLAWLADQLAQRPQWRENLPLVPLGDGRALREAVRALGATLAAELQSEAGIEALAEAYGDALANGAGSPEPFQLPQQLGQDVFPAGLETEFWRPAYPRLRLVPQPDGATQIDFGARRVTVAGLEASVLAEMLGRSRFTPWDLADLVPDLDWETELAPLLQRLVMEGILKVVDVPIPDA